MTYLNKTYGAGYRAGFTPNKLFVNHADGTKTIALPDCPFNKRWQPIAYMLFWQGYYSGLMQNLQRWLLKLRDGEVMV